MPRLDDDFVPATGLTNGHAQTVYAALFRRPREVPLRRERVETPEGDFFDVDHLDGPRGAPTVYLLHGLEGSSGSNYIRECLGLLAARGWRGVALNARGCSGTPNRLAASYSSGDCRDLRQVLSAPAEGPRYAVGFSLGGSALMNYLGRFGGAGLQGAAVVSTPYALDACARNIDADRPSARVYLQNFLPTMKAKARRTAQAHPGAFDAARAEAARTLRAFDDAYTAPLFGYPSAQAYYDDCSTTRWWREVKTPTLMLSAADDPLAPASDLPAEAAEHPWLHVQTTRRGGHVGFIGGHALRPRYWAEARALAFFDRLG
jgi:hypothetical protein